MTAPEGRTKIRLLPFMLADGPHNMAADEVMLEAAIGGVASLRLYGWNPATLSLGYFQRYEERLLDPRLVAMPWVRRATGGGAIIHDRDVTYAVALPRDWRHGLSAAEWHCRIHHVLARIFTEHEISAELVSGQRVPQAVLDYLCFAVPQPGDVVLENRKIIGGAQRLRAGALLQHGSIQLRVPERSPDALARRVASGLGWEARPGDWTSAENRRIEQLAREKYSQDWWNKKR